MGLLTAGYWPTTFWPKDYWTDDYWQDYGVPELIIAGIVTLRFAVNEVILDLAHKITLLKLGRKET